MKLLGVLVCLFCLLQSGLCCPPRCSCEQDPQTSRWIMYCRGLDLLEVPTFTPSTRIYYELTLEDNLITSIGSDAFKNLAVERILLGGNPITSIADDAFSSVQANLLELSLHVQGLDTLPRLALSGLTSLTKLDLQGFNNPALSAPFGSLTSLQELVLTNNQLASIDGTAFQGLVALQRLDLSSNNLDQVPVIPRDTLPNLRQYRLGHNNIAMLRTGDFYATQRLTLLDLSHNKISAIQEQVFVNLWASLTSLALNMNDLIDIHIKNIKPLKALTFLDLSDNKAMTLQAEVFDELTQLKVLNMSRNSIQGINKDDIKGIASSLQILRVAGNVIRSIEETSFQGFYSLLELDLHGQNMAGLLGPATLQGLVSLESLDLSSAQLTATDLAGLQNLNRLKTIKLDQNNIASVPDFSFHQWTRLELLQLSENAITDLNQQSFFGLKDSLKKVTLNKNSIREMSNCVFHNFVNLADHTFMELVDNPLHCDCRARWLRQWIEDIQPEIIRQTINWKCDSPASHQGKRLRNMTLDDFTCSPPIELPPCDVITPPTSTTISQHPLLVHVSNISDTSCMVNWEVSTGESFTGFRVEYSALNGEDEGQVEKYQHERSAPLVDLHPGTEYQAWVSMLQGNTARFRTSVDFKTLDAQPVVGDPGPNVVHIALGVVGGVVALILIILAIYFGRRFCRDDKFDPKDLEKYNKTPQPTTNTKRFSKPKTASMASSTMLDTDLEKKLEGFTREERDKILNILTHSGGTMLSARSTNSLMRYGPQEGASGYDNQEYQPEDHHYHEIPDDQHYHEIADQNMEPGRANYDRPPSGRPYDRPPPLSPPYDRPPQPNPYSPQPTINGDSVHFNVPPSSPGPSQLPPQQQYHEIPEEPVVGTYI